VAALCPPTLFEQGCDFVPLPAPTTFAQGIRTFVLTNATGKALQRAQREGRRHGEIWQHFPDHFHGKCRAGDQRAAIVPARALGPLLATGDFKWMMYLDVRLPAALLFVWCACGWGLQCSAVLCFAGCALLASSSWHLPGRLGEARRGKASRATHLHACTGAGAGLRSKLQWPASRRFVVGPGWQFAASVQQHFCAGNSPKARHALPPLSRACCPTAGLLSCLPTQPIGCRTT